MDPLGTEFEANSEVIGSNRSGAAWRGKTAHNYKSQLSHRFKMPAALATIRVCVYVCVARNQLSNILFLGSPTYVCVTRLARYTYSLF